MLRKSETKIMQALNGLSYLEGPFTVTKTYFGKAYKGNIPDGVICYEATKDYTNALMMSDRICYYLIARHYWWNAWADVCNVQVRQSMRPGLTLDREIYSEMMLNTSESEFVISYERDYFYFKRRDLQKFVESNRSETVNEQYGYPEVGFPMILHYQVKTLPDGVYSS